MVKLGLFAVFATCLIAAIIFFPKQALIARNQVVSVISIFAQAAAREANKVWDVIAGHSTTETTTANINVAPRGETLDQMLSLAKPSPSVESEYERNVKSGK